MAKTYTAYATGIAFASNKSLLGIFNAHATRKVKLYRAWVLNNQTSAVTGVLTSMLLRKISALSAGTAVTPVAHDTGNTGVDLTSVTCVTGGTDRPVTLVGIRPGYGKFVAATGSLTRSKTIALSLVAEVDRVYA